MVSLVHNDYPIVVVQYHVVIAVEDTFEPCRFHIAIETVCAVRGVPEASRLESGRRKPPAEPFLIPLFAVVAAIDELVTRRTGHQFVIGTHMIIVPFQQERIQLLHAGT